MIFAQMPAGAYSITTSARSWNDSQGREQYQESEVGGISCTAQFTRDRMSESGQGALVRGVRPCPSCFRMAQKAGAIHECDVLVGQCHARSCRPSNFGGEAREIEGRNLLSQICAPQTRFCNPASTLDKAISCGTQHSVLERNKFNRPRNLWQFDWQNSDGWMFAAKFKHRIRHHAQVTSRRQ